MHGGEPVSFAAGGGGETDYGTAANEEPTHVSSEEHSFEDAGHARPPRTRAVKPDTTAAPMRVRMCTTADVA